MRKGCRRGVRGGGQGTLASELDIVEGHGTSDVKAGHIVQDVHYGACGRGCIDDELNVVGLRELHPQTCDLRAHISESARRGGVRVARV